MLQENINTILDKLNTLHIKLNQELINALIDIEENKNETSQTDLQRINDSIYFINIARDYILNETEEMNWNTNIYTIDQEVSDVINDELFHIRHQIEELHRPQPQEDPQGQ